MSIILKLAVGRSERLLRGQQHFWTVMRALQAEHGSFTVSAIYMASNADRADIRKFMRSLVERGYIEVAGESPKGDGQTERLYRIVRDQRVSPKLSRDGGQQSRQQNMWNVLTSPYGREGIDARELAVYASTDEAPVALETAKAWLKLLARAGYLVCVAKGGPGKLAIWRLKPSMNTGPLPPMILRSKMVYDQNADRIMGDVIAQEEPA